MNDKRPHGEAYTRASIHKLTHSFTLTTNPHYLANP
jgi:hypothetical protein